MTRVFIAATRTEERSALHLLMIDLKLEVAGEAADWETTLTEAPTSRSDMLLVDGDLLPSSPCAALDGLRSACPASLAIVLISRLDAYQQAAVSSGADLFISKAENAERVADRFRAAAEGIRAQDASQ